MIERHAPQVSESEVLRLDNQIGFLLRRAYQRHASLFNRFMPDGLTPTQSSALIRLLEHGPISQNRLGRQIALDAATIKGVVDRLNARGLVAVESDEEDHRRVAITLTEEGRRFTTGYLRKVEELAEATLKPLDVDERDAFLSALHRIC
ncbi:MAG: MarR family transcriptional regulator [Acidimicrobiia bacterium]|nr:MarR family transcriptional regulator [Acidimicrobiia bacterium]